MSVSATLPQAVEHVRARVGVNLMWLVPGVVGGSEEATVAALLAAAPVAAAEGIEIVLVAAEAVFDAHPELRQFERAPVSTPKGGTPGRVLAEALRLSRISRLRSFDLLHCAGGVVPLGYGQRCTVTVHDVQPLDLPENFSVLKRRYLGWMIPRSVRRATVTCVPSQFVADRVAALVSGVESRVVPWCASPLVDLGDCTVTPMETLAPRYGLSQPYFLYPAITYPHKNHRILLEALASVDDTQVGLVFAGGVGGSEEEIVKQISELGLAHRVTRCGRVNREDLFGLYRGAVAVLFPSLYEGFGLPALEAMALGVPIVVSDQGSLPEVVGPAGLVCAAHDSAEWAEAMNRLCLDPLGPPTARENQTRVATMFSAKRTGSALVAAWLEALDLPSNVSLV